MVEDDGKKTNETNEPGKEPNPIPEVVTKPSQGHTPLEEANRINKEKAELLDREEKLLNRKEKLHAEQMVGGHTQAATETQTTKEITPEEYAKKVMAGEIGDGKE